MDSNFEAAVAGAVVLSASFGAVLSFLLERWSVLRSLWAKVHTNAKPIVLFGFLLAFSAVPVLLSCVNAPEYIMSVMKWVPNVSCSGDSWLFAGIVSVIGWTTSQAIFFKALGGSK